MKRCPTVFLLSLLLVFPTSTLAQNPNPYREFCVDLRAAPGGDGSTWEKAFNDLQDLLDRLKDPNFLAPHITYVVVYVAGGTYKPDRGTGDRLATFDFSCPFERPNFDIDFRGSLSGAGPFWASKPDYEGTPTILSGDLNGDDGPHFANRSDNSNCIGRLELHGQQGVNFDGFVFRGGNRTHSTGPEESAGGLAIVNRDSPDAVLVGVARQQNCRFESNRTFVGDGAGLSSPAAYFSVVLCTFVGNHAVNGAGGGFASLGPVIRGGLSDCRFESNRAVRGGGLSFNYGGELGWCSFLDNHADIAGGAISGLKHAQFCLFAGNASGIRGGAVEMDTEFSPYGVANSTVAHNSAPIGAAFHCPGPNIELDTCVIWGNNPPEGSITLSATSQSSRIRRSIIESGMLAIENAGTGPVQYEGNQTGDPLFIRPAISASPGIGVSEWNYRLRPGSPAEKIGRAISQFDLDRRLQPRDFLVDAGAYFSFSAACQGDLARENGMTDDRDFVRFVRAYNIGVVPPADPWADYDRDGLVNETDFAIFVTWYEAMLCPGY